MLMPPRPCQFLYFAPGSLRNWIGENVSDQEAGETNFSTSVANNKRNHHQNRLTAAEAMG
jgi:hypothetical protein